MNLVELISQFRILARDPVAPYLWSDAELVIWFAEAEEEAIARKRLIRDSRTRAIAAPSNLALLETTGSLATDTYSYMVTAINASGETELSDPVTVAVGASAGVVLSWDAVPYATGYRVYGRSGTDDELIAEVAVPIVTYTDTGARTPDGSQPTENTTYDLTNIPLVADESYVHLHECILEVTKASNTDGTTKVDMYITTREELNRLFPGGWEDLDAAQPRYLVVEDTHGFVVPTPDQAYTMNIAVVRAQVNPMSSIVAPISEPEINRRHHMKLIEWALHKAYAKKDADTYDEKRSGSHLRSFEKYFGYSPGAGRRLSANASAPHKVRSHWR